MAKKLPGLNRHAPEIDETVKSSPSRTAKKPTSSKRPKKSKPVTSRQGIHDQENIILEGEILPPPAWDEAINLRIAQARMIVERRANWAVAGGVIPIPLLDAVAISTVQLAMLNDLSKHYGVPFDKNRGKALISALVGGALPYAAGAGVAGMLMKSMPVIGWGIGLITVGALGGATTRAVGTIFIQHFETGGTFLDFDPAATHAFFREELSNAKSN
ncbi:MAG: DUF697 domain-containing protein [Halopseudomonas aestusnigri]